MYLSFFSIHVPSLVSLKAPDRAIQISAIKFKTSGIFKHVRDEITQTLTQYTTANLAHQTMIQSLNSSI